MAYCNYDNGIVSAVSGCVTCDLSQASYNNLIPKWVISNNSLNDLYLNTPIVKSFREKLEEEINNWHGNLLQELQL